MRSLPATLLVMLLSCGSILSVEYILIGGLFDTDKVIYERIFQYTAKEINRGGVLPPDKELLPIARSVPVDSQFVTSKHLCEMLGLGTVGIFGPIVGKASRHVQSVCEAKDVPHIEMRIDAMQRRGSCHVNFHPHPLALSQAYVDLIKTYEWKSFTILYEKNENLYGLSKVIQMYDERGSTITLRQLDLGLGNNYRDILYRVKKTGEVNILLHCSIDILYDVLTQAQQVGLLTDEHNFIITNLDMHTIDLEPFQYSETNISGIRIVDPTDPMIIQKVQYWNTMAGEDEENALDPEDLTVDAALMVDAMYSFASVLKELNFTKYINNVFDCDQDYPWEYGSTVTNFIKTRHMSGLTKEIKFDNEGFRTEFTLDVVELSSSGLHKVGYWDSNGVALIRSQTDQGVIGESGSLANKTFKVLTAISPPYGMIKKNTASLEGNERYEGFAIELIEELGKMLSFNYTFYIQEDGKYGSKDAKTKEWNGMLKRIMDGEFDFAITDLTVTAEREEAVDFTMPFMNLGISILYNKPTKAPPRLFSFMAPFSQEVWLYLGLSYLGVSLLIFVLARISPKEWNNPYPCIEEPDTLINQFSLPNSLWFTVGSVLQQGSELAPIAISTRMMAGIWWFFTLIMVSSYTANLAAFLTVEPTERKITSAEDLAAQTKIHYGAKVNGSTWSFFKESEFSTYQTMFKFMEEHPEDMPGGNAEAEKRVKDKDDDYAYLMESTSIEYIIERECDLAQVGGLLDDKGYAIAMKKNSPYRNELSEAVLKLQEQGKLTSMKRKWWKEKDGGGACESAGDSSSAAVPLGLPNVGGVFLVLIVGSIVATIINFADMMYEIAVTARLHKAAKDDGSGTELGMPNVGGVFFVLICGSAFATLIALVEFISGIINKAKEFKVPFTEELKEELKFLKQQWSSDTKPVRRRSPTGSTKSGEDTPQRERSESNKSRDLIKRKNVSASQEKV